MHNALTSQYKQRRNNLPRIIHSRYSHYPSEPTTKPFSYPNKLHLKALQYNQVIPFNIPIARAEEERRNAANLSLVKAFGPRGKPIVDCPEN
jgi:hypothetical protein